ncbi:MAG: histidine kinase, partial [Sulfuricurvum sp. PC08-66]
MNFGLRAKLNLISFLPIMVIVFIASYYVYSSYVTFQASQALQAKVTQNELLNDLITKIARERGMTSIFLGSHSENIATSLKGQRTKVDESLAHFKASLESHKNDTQMQHAKTLLSMLEDINGVRAKVDAQTVEFNAIFSDYYSNIEHTILKNLSRITQFELDREVKTLATLYLNLAHAKEFTSAERDFIGFLLSQNAPITDVQLNHWVSLLGRADAIGLEQIADVESLKGLYTLFMTADAQELFEDITTARTHISQMASSGEYEIEASEWFEMIGEKIRLLDEAEAILLEQINTNAKETQKEQLRILIIALVIWVAAILVAILGRVLSNQLLVNIKNLESLLKRVANSVALEKEPINLDTAKGVNQAYAMLERIIEESNEARHNALQASEAKSMFLANMSHEIRTPLNGIVGFTDLLRDTHLDQEQQEFIDIIQKSSENLLEIINNILDVSKIESNKIEIESIPFTPLAEFESAVEVYSVRASEKRINLASFIDPSLEYPLKGDPTKIKEVILNLLSNAVKFTQPNGQISVSIKKLDSVDGCATLFFEVTDSGIGVSIEQQSKIFEAFSQADTSITRKYGG